MACGREKTLNASEGWRWRRRLKVHARFCRNKNYATPGVTTLAVLVQDTHLFECEQDSLVFALFKDVHQVHNWLPIKKKFEIKQWKFVSHIWHWSLSPGIRWHWRKIPPTLGEYNRILETTPARATREKRKKKSFFARGLPGSPYLVPPFVSSVFLFVLRNSQTGPVLSC